MPGRSVPVPCHGCRAKHRPARRYLCPDCWFSLPAPARHALRRHDDQTIPRLRQLHAQLDAGVPLADIRIAA